MPLDYPEIIKQQPLDTPTSEYPFPKIDGLDKPKISPSGPIVRPLTPQPEPSPDSSHAVNSSRTHGVTRLSFVVGDGPTAIVSDTFNNGKGNGTKRGRYLDEVDMSKAFCYAPGVDKPRICWKLMGDPKHIEHIKFELFCKNRPTTIWEREWSKKKVKSNIKRKPKTAGTKTAKHGGTTDILWSGSIDWNGWLKNHPINDPAFPHGILTVEHSPYQLRMTINKGVSDSANPGYPLVAWTYIHVLVHEIELTWGTDDMIPKERTDIDPKNKDWILAEEKKILTNLTNSGISLAPDGTQPNAGHDVLINMAAFNNVGNEFNYYRQRWGDGPLIPIVASATIKTADGKGVVAPKALGKVKFLWEWQDNDGETLDEWLNRWVGDKNDATNKVSSITRHYLEEVLKENQPAEYPRHTYNCPAKAGGKRGIQRPKPEKDEIARLTLGLQTQEYLPAPVFPKQSGTDEFPFQVTHECKKRDWAAISYPNKDGKTGVLFQPAAIAGDRYKVIAYLASAQNSDGTLTIDVDKKRRHYYDLLKEAKKTALPHSSTRYFSVWRQIDMTYYYGADFAHSSAATVNTLKNKFKRELGIVLNINPQPFPNLRTNQDAKLQEVIAEDYATGGSALIPRCVFPSSPLAVNNNYAFDLLSPSKGWGNLEKLFKQQPLSIVKFRYLQAGATADGKEITSVGSAARGVCMAKPNEYSELDSEVVLLLNNTYFEQGKQIKTVEKSVKSALIEEIKTPEEVFWQTCWGLTITAKANRSYSSKTVKVEIAAPYAETTLKFKGIPTPSAKVSTELGRQLETFIKDQTVHKTGRIRITVTGRFDENVDDKDKERIDNVKTYLETHIFARKKFYEKLLDSYPFNPSSQRSLENQFVGMVELAVSKVFNKCFWKHIDERPHKNMYERDGHLFFYHLRGRSQYDTFATGGFEAGVSTEKIGVAYAFEPAGVATNRLYKDPLTLIVHELGHSVLLEHAAPRLFETKDAGGAYADHLAHDTCIMNYDTDSEAFCGVDILSKRGWLLENILTSGTGNPDDNAWIDKCDELMKKAAEQALKNHKNISNVALNFKRALFALDVRDKKSVAKQYIQRAEKNFDGQDGSAEHIWFLRNLIVFYNKIGDTQTAQQHLDTLWTHTQNWLDWDDVSEQNHKLAVKSNVIGHWKNTS